MFCPQVMMYVQIMCICCPQVILAAVKFIGLWRMMKQPTDVSSLWRSSWVEMVRNSAWEGGG